MSADLPVYHGLNIACWRDTPHSRQSREDSIEVLRAQEAEMAQTLGDYKRAQDKYTKRLELYTCALVASKFGLKQVRREMRSQRHPKEVSKGFRREFVAYKRGIRQFSALAAITKDSLVDTIESCRITCEKLQQVRTDFAFALAVEDRYVSDVLSESLADSDTFSDVADKVDAQMYDEEVAADELLNEELNEADDLVFAVDLPDEQYVNDLSDDLGSFEDFPDIAAYPGLLADEADE